MQRVTLLLDSLSSAVAAPFMVVAGFGTLLLIVGSLIPLLNIHCAYKSPLIPTAFIVMQWTTYPAALLASLPFGLLICLCEAIPLRLFTRSPSAYYKYLHCVYWPGQQLFAYLRSFGTHMRVEPRSFWTNQELQVVARDTDLECRAFLSSLITMREGRFAALKEQLQDYAPATRMRSALLVVIHALGFHRAQDVLQYYPRLACSTRLRHRAKHCIPTRHAELLLDTLSSEWPSGDPLEEHDVARILYLVHHATTGCASELNDRMDRLLRRIRAAQISRPFDSNRIGRSMCIGEQNCQHKSFDQHLFSRLPPTIILGSSYTISFFCRVPYISLFLG